MLFVCIAAKGNPLQNICPSFFPSGYWLQHTCRTRTNTIIFFMCSYTDLALYLNSDRILGTKSSGSMLIRIRILARLTVTFTFQHLGTKEFFKAKDQVYRWIFFNSITLGSELGATFPLRIQRKKGRKKSLRIYADPDESTSIN
jgi:hypothetical protein